MNLASAYFDYIPCTKICNICVAVLHMIWYGCDNVSLIYVFLRKERKVNKAVVLDIHSILWVIVYQRYTKIQQYDHKEVFSSFLVSYRIVYLSCSLSETLVQCNHTSICKHTLLHSKVPWYSLWNGQVTDLNGFMSSGVKGPQQSDNCGWQNKIRQHQENTNQSLFSNYSQVSLQHEGVTGTQAIFCVKDTVFVGSKSGQIKHNQFPSYYSHHVAYISPTRERYLFDFSQYLN